MDLRDEFAVSIAGDIAAKGRVLYSKETIARMSYEQADALMAERERAREDDIRKEG